MLDHPIRDFESEPMPGVAGEDVLLWDFLQDWLWLIINDRVAANLVLGCQTRSIGEPLLNFLAAPVGMDVRCPGNGTVQREVIMAPEPAKHEEGVAHAPSGGKNHMGIGPGIEDPAQLLHATEIEYVTPFVFVWIQNPVHVEEDNVEMHLFQDRGAVKDIRFSDISRGGVSG